MTNYPETFLRRQLRTSGLAGRWKRPVPVRRPYPVSEDQWVGSQTEVLKRSVAESRGPSGPLSPPRPTGGRTRFNSGARVPARRLFEEWMADPSKDRRPFSWPSRDLLDPPDPPRTLPPSAEVPSSSPPVNVVERGDGCQDGPPHPEPVLPPRETRSPQPQQTLSSNHLSVTRSHTLSDSCVEVPTMDRHWWTKEVRHHETSGDFGWAQQECRDTGGSFLWLGP